ncbi:MAG: hypothetical protein LBO65_01820 [Spirochaetaceae bacterium]|jgi:hypothetical protein|nr:hypothetical protein [Spirochaetaceae bacterium]
MSLDMSSRKAIVQNSHREYQQAGKKGRGEILDRLVPVTGMNRDYLAAVLGRFGKEPRTPWERLMGSADISEESKAELRRRRALYNPVELNRRLNKAVEQLLKLNREKGYTGNPPCPGGGGRVPAA